MKNHSIRRLSLVVLFVSSSLSNQASASFHRWDIVEVFSSADGSVQFIEMFTNSDGQQFANSTSGRIFSNANSFSFPTNLPAGTFNKTFLIGTTTYDFISHIDVNVPLLNYVVVDNFFSIAGDTLQLEWLETTVFDTLTFTADDLPTDGTNSLNHAFGDPTNTFFSATSSPTNFVQDTGTMTIFHHFDHYKVYGLDPEIFPTPLTVILEDQFGQGEVTLTNLGKLGTPVRFRRFEHLSWYEFFEPQPTRVVQVDTVFGIQFWTITNGHFLLVPAIKDGQGAITLGQHWKCYDADPQPPPLGWSVTLVDQFHPLPGINHVVGAGRYLCNPVEKNNEGPPPLPNKHLACYDISDDPLGETHSLDDQFGNHPNLLVENPEVYCVPWLKFVPEPGFLLSFGSGLMLLGWLDRRRRRRAKGNA